MIKAANNANSVSQINEKTAFNPPGGALTPYTGNWDFSKAAHLLRRTMFGPTREQINWSVDKGLEATIEKLFGDIPMPSPPIHYIYSDDPFAPRGQTWIEAPYSRDGSHEPQRIHRERSLFAWTMGLLWEEGMSIREKLTLFWHNHFPIEAVFDPRYKYRYITTIRKRAWGNFRELTKDITIDPSMLRYLNGNQNRKGSPNENYARELLELFTIGKGPLVGPGDYTNYTEEDIKEIARVLTGWIEYGYVVESTGGRDGFGSIFIPSLHDDGVKRLSPRFNNAEISNKGKQEYAHLIDIIFQQPETARFICRKLYRWFVYYQLDEQIEREVIEPMAQILIDNNYEIKPALSALLCSDHFYQAQFAGAMIKNPFDLIMSALKPLGIKAPNNVAQKFHAWYKIYGQIHEMQMIYYEIPQVAGWRSYYVAPTYYRDWINSNTLQPRMDYVEKIATVGHFPSDGPRIRANVLGFTAALESPLDPNAVVQEYTRLLLPQPLSLEQRNALKDILIPGLPDFEWTVEFGQYLENPGNSQLANALETKLRLFLEAILTLADFQLG